MFQGGTYLPMLYVTWMCFGAWVGGKLGRMLAQHWGGEQGLFFLSEIGENWCVSTSATEII